MTIRAVVRGVGHYLPERVVENDAFSPLERIGQLSLRNLDTEDSREKLHRYVAQGTLPASDAHTHERAEPRHCPPSDRARRGRSAPPRRGRR